MCGLVREGDGGGDSFLRMYDPLRGQAKRRPVRCHTTLFCPQGVGADSSAKGCEAALKQATLIVPDTPCVLVLLPVPGSEASPGPVYTVF
ncbi:Uncharacterized protein ALO40_02679 [Pseudomonas syringae pv. viburni]|uniref:Uncharacterized protein n=1 Tax=Pseudomonas syringae pv. viburni TaxID=251703 RepID=A0A0Q0E9R6_9PSED|nr:Uncharacterized protein ALO40_02679 [Pseudomonas syringae pv. viburni]